MVTKEVTEIPVIGGNAALDLANTLDGPRDREPTGDFLRTPADLAAWAVHAGVLDRAPSVDEGDLARARRLRQASYATFRAVAAGRTPAAGDLEALTGAAAGARLTATAGGFDLAWDGGDVLAPVAQAAVDLLRAGPLDRVKACTDCRWLFLDVSRNRSRRWCTMDECGVRSKMRRYRAKRATAGR